MGADAAHPCAVFLGDGSGPLLEGSLKTSTKRLKVLMLFIRLLMDPRGFPPLVL